MNENAKLRSIDTEMDNFYKNNPSFDINKFNFLNEDDIKALNLTENSPEFLDTLKTYQRLLKLCNDVDEAKALKQQGFDSAHKVTSLSRSQFVKAMGSKLGSNSSEIASNIYTNAENTKSHANILLANIHGMKSSYYKSMSVNNNPDAVTEYIESMPGYQDFFGDLDYCHCLECKSIFSPAAYFVDIMRVIKEYISDHDSSINEEMKFEYRRPDLYSIPLTCEKTNTLVPYLTIVNERLEATMLQVWSLQDTTALYKRLSTEIYPNELPFLLPLEKLREYIVSLGTTLHEIYKAFEVSDDSVSMESLKLSLEGWSLISDRNTDTANLQKSFDVSSLSDLNKAVVFLEKTSLNVPKLQQLLYQNLSSSEIKAGLNSHLFVNSGLTTSVTLKDVDGEKLLDGLVPQSIDSINRFIRLANILEWDFQTLDWALHCVNDGEADITPVTLGKIAKIVKLTELLDTDESTICTLLFDIKTYGIGDDSDISESPFDIIFNNGSDSVYHPKTSSGAYQLNSTYIDVPKKWLVGKNDSKNHKIAAWVASGIGLNQDDLLKLTNKICTDNSVGIDLTVEVLSVLYRHAKLPGLLHISISEYLIMLELCNLVHQQLTCDDIILLVNKSNQINNSGLGIYDLDYIVNGNLSSFVNTHFSKDKVDSWLKVLASLVVSSEEDQKKKESEEQAQLTSQIASFFNSDSAIISAVLTLIEGDDDLVSIFTGGDTAKATQMLEFISRWLVLAQKLNLTSDELENIETNSSAYSINNTRELTLNDVLTIIGFKHLIANYGDENGIFCKYISSIRSGEEDSASLLSSVTNWPVDEIKELFSVFTETNQVLRINQFATIFDIIDKTGLNVSMLLSISKLAGKGISDWDTFEDVSENVLSAIKANYSAGEEWLKLLNQINGKVDQLKRTALLSTTVKTLGKQTATQFIKTDANLYEYLLIDVNMGWCSQISYIKEALNACQLYLHRCREKLEPGVSGIADVPDVWWEWLLNYRVWQANREVFLYPENYLDPSVRISKTRLFKDLENDLRQNSINKENVEVAYKKYMDSFASLAKLVYVDAYYCRISDKTRDNARTLFLFARTTTEPYNYYYIVQEKEGYWSEWMPVNIPIAAKHITPIYAFNRLFLFWVDIKQEKSSDKKISSYRATIKYTYHDYTDNWQPAQTLLSEKTIISEPSDYRSKFKELFPDKDFDISSEVWNKVYLLKIDKAQYWQAAGGGNKFEKIAIFYGPMIDTTANINIDSGIAVSDTSSTDSTILEFEDNLRQVYENYEFVNKNQYKGQLPVYKPIILNDTLEVGYLVNPSEVIFIKQDSDQSNTSFNSQIDQTSGQLNLVSINNTIYENYVGAPVPTKDLSPQILSKSLRTKNYNVFPVKNDASSFIFYGDKEAFLFRDPDIPPAFINDNLVNADTIFDEKSFISDGANITEQGSKAIFAQLKDYGDLSEEGILASYVDAPSLIKDMRDILSDEPGAADKVSSVVNTLTNQPLFNSLSFVSSENDITKSGSTNLYNTLIQYGYLDKNGRLDAEIDFDTLSKNIYDILDGQPKQDIQTRYITDVLYLTGYPSSIGFFQHKNTGKPLSDYKFQATRLTSAVIHKLSETLLREGIDGLLNLSSQQIPVEPVLPFDRFKFDASLVTEPEVTDGEQVDFKGAYQIYYWEMFFHIPMLIANLHKTNQQFELAEKWYKYIFDPTTELKLINEDSFETTKLGSRDSVRIHKTLLDNQIITLEGYVSPEFDKSTDLSTMLSYLDSSEDVQSVKNILLNFKLGKNVSRVWQFNLFRNHTLQTLLEQLTDEGEISQYNKSPFDPHAIARLRIGAYEKAVVMQYVDNLIKWGDYYFSQYSWETITTATTFYIYAKNLLGPRPNDLGPCSTESTETFGDIADKYKDKDIPQFLISLEDHISLTEGSSVFRPFNDLDSYFCVPDNSKLIAYWDLVDDRMYKINHCLNIDGVQQPLPLFQPSIDLMNLVNARSTGGDVLSLLSQETSKALPYRFSYLIGQTKNFVATVQQFGSQLLSALEKNDEAALEKLRSNQRSHILDLTTYTKKKQTEEIEHSIDGLKESRLNAQNRHVYYSNLYNNNISPLEIASLAVNAGAIIPQAAAVGIQGISIAGYLAPCIFGFSDGGMKFGDAINAGAAVSQTTSAILSMQAGLVSTNAQYERRREEWGFQRDSAQYDLTQIEKQIESSQARLSSLNQELKIHNTTIEQEDKYWQFIDRKFTNEKMYQWMIQSLSAVYFQSYQMALSMATACQNAYKNELDSEDQFLNFGSWDSLYKGLLSGEGLMLSLNRMEKSYVENNTRRLEIEKTISLLHLDPNKFIEFKTGLNGGKRGILEIELNEQLFDFDFPGQYCRKIKSVSVSIPAILGPYQNINATLRQKSNTIILSPKIDAVKYAIDPKAYPNPPDGSIAKTWVPTDQQIALSHGIDDTGLFVLNFEDSRYLPFEETGAVSTWELSIPPDTNHFDINSISDIILNIKYTAKYDSGLESDVRQFLTSNASPYPYAVSKQFVMEQAFSGEWFKFLHTQPISNMQTMSFALTDDIILPNLNDVTLHRADLFIETKGNFTVSDNKKQQFVSLKIGDGDYNPISIENNYGNTVIENEVLDKIASIQIDVSKAPANILTEDQKKLDPDKITGMIFVITYSSNVFNNKNGGG